VEPNQRKKQTTQNAGVTGDAVEEYLLDSDEIPDVEYGLGESDAPIRRYLLGDLSPEERQQIEVRILTDDTFHERVEVIEDELIDEYLYGELEEDERQRLSEIFTDVPAQHQKIKFTEDVRTYALGEKLEPAAHEHREEARSWWRGLAAFLGLQNPPVGFAISAALLLCVLGGVLLLIKVRRLESLLAMQGAAQTSTAQEREQELQRQLEQQRSRIDELGVELRQAQQQRDTLDQEIADLMAKNAERPAAVTGTKIPSGATLASIFLPLVQGRGPGQAPKLTLSTRTRSVRLILDLDTLRPDSYRSYAAEVSEVNGSTIWNSENLRGQSRGGVNQISLSLSANRFHAGDYQVKLTGLNGGSQHEAIGVYYFRVSLNIPEAKIKIRDMIILPTPTP
jgi:hypothetical protein